MSVRIARWVMLAAVGTACGGASTLAPADVAGTYVATTISVIINGVTTNMLVKGASVSLTLTADGKSTGRVIVPVIGGVQTVAVDDDLAGSYDLTKDHVQLKPTAATYLSGMIFTADLPELRAYLTIQDASRSGQLTIILRHQ
jgi:hypothetical protein